MPLILMILALLTVRTQAATRTPDTKSELPPVVLSLGEQRFLTIPGLRRYSLGAPILHTLRSPEGHPDSILLKATHPGLTDLWVWKRDGSTEHRPIEVRAWGRGPVTDLERRLADLNEVEIWVRGDPAKDRPVYLAQGEVTTEVEAARIGRLLEAYPESFESHARLSETLFVAGERRLRALLARARWASALELTADPETRMLLVRGGVDDPRWKDEAERALRRESPLATLEIDAFPDRNPTIHFKVFLLELRKNRARSFGLDLPAVIPNALRISSLGIHSAISIEAAINALEADGEARILSQPELVVRAPGEAELFAGGEVPIESKTPYSARVDWRSYGLTLKLKVQAVAGRKVRTDIQTEVSHLDPKLSSDSIPGLQANRMKTEVDATFDQPLFLSGLLQEGVKKAVRGLPLLKDLPILGSLFGSEDYLEDRSELVAILLPSRAIPEAPRVAIEMDKPEGPVPLPRNWLSPHEEIALRSSPNFPWNAFPDDPAADPDEAPAVPPGSMPAPSVPPEDFTP